MEKLKKLRSKVREFTQSTVSAAEFIADTATGETKYFADRALRKLSLRWTGPTVTQPQDASLDPLAGIMDDRRWR